ncbi:hypothetical protein T01_7909 [Trichinella spiralis]|uniref:Uncharacterized protein n=1 Tax=Trichinella spiralis TaxID=6334 RepID=A0A0V0Z256_TRISP|nr:hypothetical protein T01_7909 [Trichinella spiralis]
MWAFDSVVSFDAMLCTALHNEHEKSNECATAEYLFEFVELSKCKFTKTISVVLEKR